ncbi:putative FAD binding protein [Lasiosphaeria ovina]|uniref:FAD binding protein n=1 Tax=Lasiosphaeria ovina TaxID=92902 RepID=A0AAE0KBJ1_9PEZI|nr:putative FAD binding protein [Lasiosphaeria ovina]
MTRVIVVLGAGLAGTPIAHYLLKHLAAKVVGGLKVILVSPNTHFFANIPSVRAILPDMIPESEIFIPIAPAFAHYPAGQFEFVVGKAEQLDPGSNSVTVRENNGGVRQINYDDIVIATGSAFKEGMPLKNLSTTEETKQSLLAWSERIKAAKSIVVAGAGATGIEIAGELGQEYASAGTKDITLVADGELPLASKYKQDVRETVKRELEKLGVKVIVNSKVSAVTEGSGGKEQTTLQLTTVGTASKTSLKTDLLLPTYGITPNTAFVPAELLDARGLIKQTPLLRAEGYDNVFVVGDAGNIEEPSGQHADAQAVHVVKLIEAHVLGESAGNPAGEYKPNPKIGSGWSLGKKKGTGQIGNMRLWGWIIVYFKSKTLGIDKYDGIVKGEKTLLQKSW